MDSVVESAFLALIEERSWIVLSKSNLKEHREKRTEVWIWIAQQLLVVTGKEFTAVQLQKKWNNMQQRLKDRLRDCKKLVVDHQLIYLTTTSRHGEKLAKGTQT